MGRTVDVHRVSFGGVENVLKLGNGNDCTTL